MRCPAGKCAAEFQPVMQLARPGDTVPTLATVPRHVVQFVGVPGQPTCPASLLPLPLTDHAQRVVDEAFEGLIRSMRRREEVPPHGRKPVDGTEHSLTPHPRPDSHWFNGGSNAGGGPQPHDHLNNPSRPVLRLLPADGSIPASKGAPLVSSVAEVHGALDAANQQITEAQAQAVGARESIEHALAQVNFVRDTSVDAMGAPHLASALDLCQDVINRLTAAIEANNTYAATL